MRLLAKGSVYSALGSSVLRESEYEALILQHAKDVFPGWWVVPFKMTIESPYGNRRPDLALVAPDFQQWWVVEVELAHHPMQEHVYPQVQAFASGDYGESHATALHRHLSGVDLTSLQEMVRNYYPRVHVVVNQEVPGWLSPLHDLSVTLSVVEIYRSDEDEYAMRIAGSVPSAFQARRSYCERDRVVKNAFRLKTPEVLSGVSGSFEVLVDGRITTWYRTDDSSHLIFPSGGDPFGDARGFFLIEDTPNIYHGRPEKG